MIVDMHGHILASHAGCDPTSTLHLPEFSRVLTERDQGLLHNDIPGQELLRCSCKSTRL